jgi:tRNA dimethylallyltransferase
MIQAGWIDEVRSLLERGYSPELPSLSSLGYRELIGHLKGKLSLDAAVERIKHSTHRFARHQYAWFRHSDARIRWYDGTAGFDLIEESTDNTDFRGLNI